jgi:hypothetical protein
MPGSDDPGVEQGGVQILGSRPRQARAPVEEQLT